MPDFPDSPGTYDSIAHLYDVDMARNMAFDDVSCYAAIALRAEGRVLELGCGNGRILLSLLAQGIEVVGVDRSAGMLAQLRRKSAASGTDASVCQMDARVLGFGQSFAGVFCPYSLITYMASAGDAQRMLAECARVLCPGGMVVVDAFIPRPTIPSDDFRPDYRRALGDAILARSKRVTVMAASVNRIERRYEVVARDGTPGDVVETVEHIRTFQPDQLVAMLEHAGFAIESTLWDYGSASGKDSAQFCTLIARKPAGATG